MATKPWYHFDLHGPAFCAGHCFVLPLLILFEFDAVFLWSAQWNDANLPEDRGEASSFALLELPIRPFGVM